MSDSIRQSKKKNLSWVSDHEFKKMALYFLSAVLIFHQHKRIGKLKNMTGTQKQKYENTKQKTIDVKMQSKK